MSAEIPSRRSSLATKAILILVRTASSRTASTFIRLARGPWPVVRAEVEILFEVAGKIGDQHVGGLGDEAGAAELRDRPGEERIDIISTRVAPASSFSR